MTVSLATASDAPRIRELSRYSKAGFDPDEELARPWARLWGVSVCSSISSARSTRIGRGKEPQHRLRNAKRPPLPRRSGVVGRRRADASGACWTTVRGFRPGAEGFANSG